MYERTVNGRVLEFGHSGILYESSFVLYDRETESLWVQATGRANYGPLKGQRLRLLNSTVTTWERWKKAYPATLVLPGPRSGRWMGTYYGMSGSERIGLSVVVNFKAKLYPFGLLKKQNIVNDRFNGSPLVVYYSTDDNTAVAWNRTAGKRTLTFGAAGRKDESGNSLLRDEETRSLWSWMSGEAVAGPLKGQRLAPVNYHPILNERFKAFYPEAPIYR